MTFVVYRKCQCTVYALEAGMSWGRCGRCGVKPTEMPDYQDYVKVRQELAAVRRRLMELETL